MKGKKLGKRNQYSMYSPHEDEAEFAGAAQDVQVVYCLPNGKRIKSSLVQHGEQALMAEHDPSVTCPRCEKNGHSADNCWKDKICAKCGIQGHIAAYCRAGKGKDFKNAKFTQVQK
jgi:hypothetical protein